MGVDWAATAAAARLSRAAGRNVRRNGEAGLGMLVGRLIVGHCNVHLHKSRHADLAG